MSYQDRGMLKWQGFMLSDHLEDIEKVNHDSKKIEKPLLDEYQIEEYEIRICEAMEYNSALKISIWVDGFIEEKIVKVHYLDNVKKQIRAKDSKDYAHIINFTDIIGVEINED